MNKHLSIRINRQLIQINKPIVMGIINVTPDSFAEHCNNDEAEIKSLVTLMLNQGAKIIDVGGYSTRPGAEIVSEQEEWTRINTALKVIRDNWKDNVIISLDTWRADIAKKAVDKYGEMIINDVSGGKWDAQMFNTVADLKVPYVLTHNNWLNEQQQIHKQPDNNIDSEETIRELIDFFQKNLDLLHRLGVADVILDPGFGFGKSLEENYIILKHLDILDIFQCPILVGLSRKSMLFKLLGCTAKEALNATTAANMAALERGADILRVHNVKEAMETIEIYKKIC